MNKIDRPIFIVGAARSGTTILYSLFTRHVSTGFPEHFMNKYYRTPWKFHFIPLLLKQQIIRYKTRPLPTEGAFWQKNFPFGSPLDETNVSKEIEGYLKKVILCQLKAFHAKRFVNKQIDFCLRIKFLNKLFPDAYYIQISREPKAVVNSLYQMMQRDFDSESQENYLHGYQGWKTIKERYSKEGIEFDSCMNYLKYYKKTLERDISLVKERTINLKYDQFVKDPQGKLKELYEFVGLDWYNDLEKKVPKILEQKNDEKWLSLPSNEKKILMEEFGTNNY